MLILGVACLIGVDVTMLTVYSVVVGVVNEENSNIELLESNENSVDVTGVSFLDSKLMSVIILSDRLQEN